MTYGLYTFGREDVVITGEGAVFATETSPQIGTVETWEVTAMSQADLTQRAHQAGIPSSVASWLVETVGEEGLTVAVQKCEQGSSAAQCMRAARDGGLEGIKNLEVER